MNNVAFHPSLRKGLTNFCQTIHPTSGTCKVSHFQIHESKVEVTSRYLSKKIVQSKSKVGENWQIVKKSVKNFSRKSVVLEKNDQKFSKKNEISQIIIKSKKSRKVKKSRVD